MICCAGRNHARAVAREQYEIETVFYLINAVLDGDARHRLALRNFGPWIYRGYTVNTFATHAKKIADFRAMVLAHYVC